MGYYRYGKYGSSDNIGCGTYIIMLIIVAIVFAIISGCQHDAYNHGICRECGGHMKFVYASSYTRSTRYTYECEKCGRRVTTNFYEAEASKDVKPVS